MSILEITGNSNYSIDINNGYYTFICKNLTGNINIELPDSQYYDINWITFYNCDNTYNCTIIPYTGASIQGGNITLSTDQYCNLYSFNNKWFRA